MVGCTLMTHGLDRDLHPTARVEAALREGEGGYAESGMMRSEPVWIVKLTMEKQYTDLKSARPRGYFRKGHNLEKIRGLMVSLKSMFLPQLEVLHIRATRRREKSLPPISGFELDCYGFRTCL